MTPTMAAWSEIVLRLSEERTYWLGTVGPDASPHTSPVWGAVVEDVWYCFSERSTIKARNLALNTRVVLHLSDGEDVLIVRGRLHDIGVPALHLNVVTAFARKYARPADQAFLPLADPAFDVMYALDPVLAMLWRLADYDRSQRRWRSADPRPA